LRPTSLPASHPATSGACCIRGSTPGRTRCVGASSRQSTWRTLACCGPWPLPRRPVRGRAGRQVPSCGPRHGLRACLAHLQASPRPIRASVPRSTARRALRRPSACWSGSRPSTTASSAASDEPRRQRGDFAVSRIVPTMLVRRGQCSSSGAGTSLPYSPLGIWGGRLSYIGDDHPHSQPMCVRARLHAR
jgi:hypothetical protein